MSTYFTYWTLNDLRKQFLADLPELCIAANETTSACEFKERIKSICSNKTIERLVAFDGQTICDFSTGQDVFIQTFSLLHTFLQGINKRKRIKPDTEAITEARIDLFTDLYHLLCDAFQRTPIRTVTEGTVKNWAKRWASFTNPIIQEAQKSNKQHIINKLVQRLNRKHSINTSYYLPDFLSLEEKQRLVEEWWGSSRFHLSMAIKSPEELNFYLDNALPEETMKILHKAKKKGIPFFITPYYLSLLYISGATFDDASLRSYILYSEELVETFGSIKAWEKEDEVEHGKANAAGWMLPEGNNIHRRYPEVAILIPDSAGRACGGLCASCQRMYDFQSKRLNFNLKELAPKESWPAKLKKLMTYFEEDKLLRDILITGGDALMSRNTTLRNILDAIYKMALQKKRKNELRPVGEKYAEIERIRLGTRLPAYLPMRIDEELITILKEFHEKASLIGIKQFFVQTHFQTPLEMTKEAIEGIKRLTSAGWIVTNQLVFNVASSRRGHTVALRRTLINNGIIPYYSFSVKGFNENYAVYTPIARSMQERAEEKVYGTLNQQQEDDLIKILYDKASYTKSINNFLQKNNLHFFATDRSVLNLPGVGKSMTFQLIGITEEGKRIHRFEHDKTRKHSTSILELGEIYITENKSILAYLKQLELLGEEIRAYQSIWRYTEGITEPKFKLYEYPEQSFEAI